MLRGITLTSPQTDFGVKTSYESFTKSVSRDMWSTSKAREAPKFIALVGYSTGRIDSPRGYGVQCGVAYITRNFPEVRWPPQTCTCRCEAKYGVTRNLPIPRGEGTISPGFLLALVYNWGERETIMEYVQAHPQESRFASVPYLAFPTNDIIQLTPLPPVRC